MATTADSLRGLLDKYREIKRLRDEAEQGAQLAVRERLAALAARFPGALRELDRLPMTRIEERIAVLEAAVAGAPALPWMELTSAYHGWMRVALRIKREAASRAASSVWDELCGSYRPAADEPTLEAIGLDGVRAILAPPNGRLNAWVFARLAERFELAESTVRALVFDAGG